MPFSSVIALFLVASLIQAFAYGLTFLLPGLFESIGSGVSHVGQTLSLVGAAAIATAIALSPLTARFGQIPILVACCGACAVALSMLALATSPGPVIWAAALLLGVGWSGFYVLGPIILSQILRPEQRSRYFSWLAAFIMAGIGGGPVLGYAVQEAGAALGVAFLIAAGFSVAAGLIFGGLAPAIGRHTPPSAEDERILTLRTAGTVLRSRAWRPIVMVALGASAFAAVMNFQSIYADQNGQSYALFYVIYTLTVIVGRFIVAAWGDRIAPYALITGFLTSMALAVALLLPGLLHPAPYALAAVLFGIGYGLAYPLLKSMAANDAAPGLRDATLQLFGLTYFLGVFGFPLVGAYALTSWGMDALLAVALVLSLVEAALAALRHLKDRLETRPV